VRRCINRRKPVPERTDRGGTLRYAWLRAPPLRRTPKNTPEPPVRRLTQKAPYEGGQIVLSQKVAGFELENQLFEKIQDWRARC
jgi:hypothetical protein